MLRVYFLQNWYALSDPMAEESLYDSDAMRHFAGIELGDDRIPDGPRDRGRSAAA
jgi:IS5 family transposase